MAMILMPALSPTMTEGKLSKWLVSEGDEVRSGDVIAEIETDKAVMEVEALDDGAVASLFVAEGSAGIAVGTAIAEILADGEAAAVAAPQAPPAVEAPSAPPAPKTQPVPPTPTPAAPISSQNRIFSSPLARRVAGNKGIDLTQIKGSGPRGRIILADVEGLTASLKTQMATATPSDTPTNTPTNMGASSTLVENSPMRMVIAERLQQSKQQAPHFYLNMDIDIGAMLAARQSLNAHAPDGVKISVNDMIIKAAAIALMRIPAANGSWEGQHSRYFNHADISVAVAIDGGLVTPIVRQAEEKGLYAISSEMADLAKRARSGKLTPQDYTGGSFTISNLGMYGITSFSAVINPPQGAILAIGAGEDRAVVRDGSLVVAKMMTATLSCDHRVVDGAVGAEWLRMFKNIVENPVLALA